MARNQLIELATASLSDLMKDHQQEPLSMDDVTAMIAGQIGQLLPMDEETAKQFQTLDMIPSSRTLKYKKTYLGVFYFQEK